MKVQNFVVAAVVSFLGLAAQAGPINWESDLENYKGQIEKMSTARVWAHHVGYIAMATGTCAVSVTAVASSFLAETLPMTGAGSEGIANLVSPEYKSYEQLLSWDNLAASGRTATGGAAVATAEFMKFASLWLGGNHEDFDWEQTKKTYQSSMATFNALFADHGQCMMSISKVIATRAEILKRNQAAVDAQNAVQDQTLILPLMP